MKPLRRAPLTEEDWAVWHRFEDRPGWYGYSGYVEADRRDAELMLGAHIAPLCDCCHEQMSVMYFDGQLIDIRGTVVHLP